MADVNDSASRRRVSRLAVVIVSAFGLSSLLALPALAEKIHGIEVGKTVLLAERTRTSNCTLGANPDRRCSPGAYYSKLTKSRICASDFRTGPIRDVPQSEKNAVKVEYGLEPKPSGSTLEIDHIVSLELGGSNDIANLFPEKANADPGYHAKDKLENKLHDLVCDGTRTLSTVRRQIAKDWQGLYKSVFGVAPTD
jgi:hypothetical protein